MCTKTYVVYKPCRRGLLALRRFATYLGSVPAVLTLRLFGAACCRSLVSSFGSSFVVPTTPTSLIQVEDALLPIAQAEADLAKAEGGPPALIFFTVKSEASLPQQVRNVCDLKAVSDSPQVSFFLTCGTIRPFVAWRDVRRQWCSVGVLTHLFPCLISTIYRLLHLPCMNSATLLYRVPSCSSVLCR